MSGRDKALNIFNKDYQQARVQQGNKDNKNFRMSCCEDWMLGVFKHLVHIFVVVIVISFYIMIYMVALHGEDGYDVDIDW